MWFYGQFATPNECKGIQYIQEKIASTYTYVADVYIKNAANEFIPAQGQVMKILKIILLILLFRMMEVGKNVVTHDCPINHEGSASSMEAAGLVDCFMNSIQNRKLRYTHYIGDGDSKAYNEVVDPYPGVVVEKLQCVGHIQNHLGGHLRNLKHTMKGPLADGKTLSGKGRLTDKVINKLQNYFGIANRQSAGNTVYQLKKVIGAVLFHCSEAADLKTCHQMCPQTADS